MEIFLLYKNFFMPQTILPRDNDYIDMVKFIALAKKYISAMES